MPVGDDGKADWRSGIGVGAYRLDNFEPGVRSDLSKFENHWNPDKGHFDSIELLSLVDLNARTTALVSGSVDVIDRLDLKTVGLMARDPSIQIHSVNGNAHYTIPMDCRKAPFDDNNIRLALKYGVNRQELVDKILFGYGSPGNDHPIGSGQRYFNTDLPQTEYDPDQAKFYLDKAGLTNLSVDLSASDAAFGGAVDAAVLYQNSAKGAGIDINVVREPNDGYWSDVWMKKGWVMSYWGGRPVEDQMFSTAYSEGAAWNESYWSHDRFNEILVEARAELDDNLRREMYWEMQTILNREGGSVIPMYNAFVFATKDNLEFNGDFATNWDMDGERCMELWSFA
jgi:peptide/nickel transport system substrate-binding protein